MSSINRQFLLSVRIAVAALVFPAFASADELEKPAAVKIDPTPVTQSSNMIKSFAPVVEKVTPSVVTVATKKNMPNNAGKRRGLPFFNDPMFRKYFGIPDNEDEKEEGGAPDAGKGKGGMHKEAMGLGSGVIVSPDGLILTNNHVVDGADDIIVSIAGDRKEYTATRVGADAATDLAVLRIEAKDLPAITFADSDKVRVGDISIAIGNPFGLTQTVSMGIVSALGRSNLNILGSGYEDFIQTDASINPGNSGGALVDIEGRLIGVNTAIFSRTGGNQGIGFAVPANLAHTIMDSLLKDGRVVRGFLGVRLQELDEDLRGEFNFKDGDGSLVAQVEPESPAANGGVEAGDVIIALDGKPVENTQNLRMRVSSMAPGTKVMIKVMREGKEKELAVELGELDAKLLAGGPAVEPEATAPDVLDGVTVGNITDEVRQKYGIPEKANGVVVESIDENSLSARAGIRVGDVVHEIDRQPVKTADDAVEMSKKLMSEKQVLLRVSTRGVSRFVVVKEE